MVVVEPPLGVLELQVCGVEHLEVVVVAVGAPLVPRAVVEEPPVAVLAVLFEVEQVAPPVVLEEQGQGEGAIAVVEGGQIILYFF